MRTIVHNNENPIEMFEATQLVIASALHEANDPLALVGAEQRDRIVAATPLLVKSKL
jgi:hypothetical protein